jgi:hypothetical protein
MEDFWSHPNTGTGQSKPSIYNYNCSILPLAPSSLSLFSVKHFPPFLHPSSPKQYSPGPRRPGIG